MESSGSGGGVERIVASAQLGFFLLALRRLFPQ
jgi:hypothetical protein